MSELDAYVLKDFMARQKALEEQLISFQSKQVAKITAPYHSINKYGETLLDFHREFFNL